MVVAVLVILIKFLFCSVLLQKYIPIQEDFIWESKTIKDFFQELTQFCHTLQHVGNSWLRTEPVLLQCKMQKSLNYCTTREALKFIFDRDKLETCQQ